MSKGSSHLFSATSGEGRSLVDEVIANGDKISPDKVLLITRDPTGKIVWLEEGNGSSGLEHIIQEHGKEFNGRGISYDEIPDYLLEAVYQGNVVGTQGRGGTPRTIYEFVYNGESQRVAVQVGSNGYIVSANLVSMED